METLSSRRTSVILIYEILMLLRHQPALKTKIMYSVKMNYQQTKRHLNKLLAKGYIENTGSGGRTGYFGITELGLEMLVNWVWKCWSNCLTLKIC